jgi:hypothetical protein
MPLSIRLKSGFPAKGAVADDPDDGGLDRLALCVICRLMRSLVLILEGLREVLFHTDDAAEVTAPLTDDVGDTLAPVE